MDHRDDLDDEASFEDPVEDAVLASPSCPQGRQRLGQRLADAVWIGAQRACDEFESRRSDGFRQQAPQPPDLFPITPPTSTSVSGMEGVAYSYITVEYDECARADRRDLAFTLRAIPSGDGTTVSEPDGSAI